MKTFQIEGAARTDLGKKATKQIRREGQVPCVIYGEEKNTHFTAPTKAFKNLVYSPEFFIVEVSVDGQTHKTVMKDLQFHPVTDQLLHIDFMPLVDDRKIILDLPLVFEGLAEGVKAGGKLLPKERKLKVKAFPKDLLPELKVDVSPLTLGKSMKVGDLSYDKLEIMNNVNIPIVSVEIPRALKSAQSKEAATTEAAAE